MRSRAKAKQAARAKRADEEQARVVHTDARGKPILTPDIPPPLKGVQRARVVVKYDDARGLRGRRVARGWAQLDGVWVLFLEDESDHWVSWPIQNVLSIEWEPDGQ